MNFAQIKLPGLPESFQVDHSVSQWLRRHTALTAQAGMVPRCSLFSREAN
jgi:hypothetical protein